MSRPASRASGLFAGFIGLALLASLMGPGSTSAMAAVPPLELAAERQAALRASANIELDISMSVTTSGVEEFSGRSIDLVEDEDIELRSADAESRLKLGSARLLPYRIVAILLTSSNPLEDLQGAMGRVDAAEHDIEVLDDAFVFVFGDMPAISLSRDLEHIRRIEARSKSHSWQILLTGELGERGLPEHIQILRSGEPYARIELSEAKQGGD